MIQKPKKYLFKKVLFLIVLLIVVGGSIYYKYNNTKISEPNKKPQYFSFLGRYVFDVPDNFNVDDQAIIGLQLIYRGELLAQNIEDVYGTEGISIQAIENLTDQSEKGFKEYVNKSIVDSIKKNLSGEVDVKFSKSNNYDIARIVVIKNGNQVRVAQIKGGKHPVAVVAKGDSDVFKTITTSIVDVEKSDLSNDHESIRKLIDSAALLIKEQKAKELFELYYKDDSKNQMSEEQLMDALKKAELYTKNKIINSFGGGYKNDEFSSMIRYSTAGNETEASFVTVSLKKVNGNWKLKGLSLPTPPPATNSNSSKKN